MTGLTTPTLTQAPQWVTAEMPPGYQTRLVEINRLSADLRAMDDIGRLLWETGDALRDPLLRVFSALKCEVEATPGAAEPIVVKVGESQRLLIVVSGTGSRIEKTHDELTRAFQAVQFAGADDRVVLVVNSEPATPPAERSDPISADALSVLQKMGVDVVTAVTLFKLWRLSLEDEQKARTALDRLHAQDGGVFVIPPR